MKTKLAEFVVVLLQTVYLTTHETLTNTRNCASYHTQDINTYMKYLAIDYTILDWTLEIGPFAGTSYGRFF